jgi:RHS repeat-associated protein
VHTVYNGTQPIPTYNAAGALTARYVYGAGQNEQLEQSLADDSLYYYQHDALGSVTALTDSAGVVVDSYRYTAFGHVESTGAVADPFTYIGAPTDPSTGLVYLHARYHDPTTGRFISEDPLIAVALYPYSNNDPIDLSDPSGRISADEELEAEAIGGEVDD